MKFIRVWLNYLLYKISIWLMIDYWKCDECDLLLWTGIDVVCPICSKGLMVYKGAKK